MKEMSRQDEIQRALTDWVIEGVREQGEIFMNLPLGMPEETLDGKDSCSTGSMWSRYTMSALRRCVS